MAKAISRTAGSKRGVLTLLGVKVLVNGILGGVLADLDQLAAGLGHGLDRAHPVFHGRLSSTSAQILCNLCSAQAGLLSVLGRHRRDTRTRRWDHGNGIITNTAMPPSLSAAAPAVMPAEWSIMTSEFWVIVPPRQQADGRRSVRWMG